MSEFSFLTEILTEVELPSSRDYKIVVLLLLSSKYEKLASCDIMGRDSVSLLTDACRDYDCHVVHYSGEADYVSIALPYARVADYVVLLHLDTPLVTRDTLHDAVMYATDKEVDICHLHRGVILSSSAIIQDRFELSCRADFLLREDFIRVHDSISLMQAREILRCRIIDAHIKNGVNITSGSNVYIDYDVTIDDGVSIYPFNSIRGNTHIGKNVRIMEHNIIEDSTIGDDSVICSSVVIDSKIAEKSTVYLEKHIGEKV